jgi:ssDNA-binding replication factor A large subunit
MESNKEIKWNTLNELKNNQSGVNIKVVIISKDPTKPYTSKQIDKKTNLPKTGMVAHCKVQDNTGEGYLTLWDKQTEQYEVGDIVTILDGFAKLYEGNVNLTSGFSGMMSKGE